MPELSNKARIYIFSMILSGGVVLAWQLPQLDWSQWLVWVFAAVASVAQIRKVDGPTPRSTYNIALLVYGFTFVQFGMPAALFVILASHLAEWIYHKILWYIQIFNIGMYALVVVAMSGLNLLTAQLALAEPMRVTLDVMLGAAGFTLLNHLLVGSVIWAARGQNFRQSGVFGRLTLMIDITLLCLGMAAALLWRFHPLAAVLPIIPLFIIYSTLQLPALQRKTELDAKTGLFNARVFRETLEKEFARARRFERPLTVVMGDLDLLRNINNTYGHLAGDVVIEGIARILQEAFRGLELVARFGGEEFSVILPETTPEKAAERVERIRARIAAHAFQVETSVVPIQATMSFGIAGIEASLEDASALLHNADVALYTAKASGRNCVCVHTDEGVQALFKTGSVPVAPVEERYPVAMQAKTPMDAPPGGETASPSNFDPADPPGSPSLVADQEKPRPVSPVADERKINAYIGLVLVLSVLINSLTYPALAGQAAAEVNWLGLGIFALILVLTEVLSIEIYHKEASVSTSAAAYISGVLLFGSPAVVLFSALLAGTAMIKKQSELRRLVFNFANHLLAGGFCLAVLRFMPPATQEAAQIYQLALSIIVAGIVYASSTGFLSGAISLTSQSPLVDVWRKHFLWLGPYYLAFGVAAYGLIVGYHYAGVLGALALLVPVFALRYSQVQYLARTRQLVGELQANNQRLEQQGREIIALNEQLLETVARILDLRDSFTYGHSENVSRLAGLLARELGLPSSEIESLEKACTLHDIGKLGVPEAIIYKPGSLTSEEYDEVKKHVVLGFKLVAAAPSMASYLPVIRHHHERWDGGGYPDGLCGEQIPLLVRIASLADAVEAMSSDRPYRKALSPERMLAEVRSNAGSQFDPQIVEVFCRLVEHSGRKILDPAQRSRRLQVELPLAREQSVLRIFQARTRR